MAVSFFSAFPVSLSTQSRKWAISCQFDDNASLAPLVSFSEDVEMHQSGIYLLEESLVMGHIAYLFILSKNYFMIRISRLVCFVLYIV